MTTARAEVLGRVRRALADAPQPPPVVRSYRTRGEHEPGSPVLLGLLADRLTDYRATVHRCAADGVAAAVAGVLRDLHPGAAPWTVAVPPGLPDDVRPGLTGVRVLTDGATGGDPALTVAELDGVDVVVTGCAVAVAETGTLVLDGSPDCGRRVLTLVPDVHVVVVRAERVVQTVPEALARLDPRRPTTLVSGPSATSDIELSRVEGVHGPRTQHVVLVDAAVAQPAPREDEA